MVEEARHAEDFVAGGALRGPDLEAVTEDLTQIVRVHGW